MTVSDRQGAGRWAAVAAVNVAAVIFGSVALFGKIDASPLWIVAGRGAFAAAALLALAAVRAAPLAMPRRRLAGAAATGALLALHWVGFFASVQWAGVAVGTLTISAFPLFTILIDAVARRRAPTMVELVAGLAIVVAVGLIAGPGVPITPLAQLGAVVGLASAACFAVFALASQRLARTTNPITLSLHQNAFVALLLAPTLAFVPQAPDASAWLAIAALGAIATALAHQLYLFGLSRLPAAVCGAFVSLEPVYAIVFAAVLFGDPLPAAVLASAALIVAAPLLLLRQFARQSALA